jgi:hypothetical protein
MICGFPTCDTRAARQGERWNEAKAHCELCGAKLEDRAVPGTLAVVRRTGVTVVIDKDDGISGYFQVVLHPDLQHLTGA